MTPPPPDRSGLQGRLKSMMKDRAAKKSGGDAEDPSGDAAPKGGGRLSAKEKLARLREKAQGKARAELGARSAEAAEAAEAASARADSPAEQAAPGDEPAPAPAPEPATAPASPAEVQEGRTKAHMTVDGKLVEVDITGLGPGDGLPLTPKQKFHIDLVEKSYSLLSATMDPSELEGLDDEARAKELRERIGDAIDATATEMDHELEDKDRPLIIKRVLNEMTGLGPLQELVDEEDISEIMINGPRQTFIERRGKLQISPVRFRDNEHLVKIIQKIVSAVGRNINEEQPLCDCRLLDGSRVNAVIPPLAVDGASLTIRKFAKEKLGIKDLIRFGTVTEEMADFLQGCVVGRLNIVVSGGTGSGKTTTLNILSNFIPDDERIITVEDAAELQLRKMHVVRLETRPPNLEGKGAITIRDLVKNTLRMRPERIVVGEIRGGEALDMLQAMNTGHDGSLTTGHANTPRDMMRRIETMVMMSGMDLPLKAIREQIASAVHLVIQQSRLQDGSRKITHITEIQGMEGDVITLSDIFRFQQTGVDSGGKIVGRLKPTGLRPKFITHLEEHGIQFPPKLFMAGADDF